MTEMFKSQRNGNFFNERRKAGTYTKIMNTFLNQSNECLSWP